jgi:hypothetical protein
VRLFTKPMFWLMLLLVAWIGLIVVLIELSSAPA